MRTWRDGVHRLTCVTQTRRPGALSCSLSASFYLCSCLPPSPVPLVRGLAASMMTTGLQAVLSFPCCPVSSPPTAPLRVGSSPCSRPLSAFCGGQERSPSAQLLSLSPLPLHSSSLSGPLCSLQISSSIFSKIRRSLPTLPSILILLPCGSFTASASVCG